MEFNLQPLQFGRRAEPEDEAAADDPGADAGLLPKPLAIKASRRMAGIKEAKAILEHLPKKNQSVHFLATARMDATDFVSALIEKTGQVEALVIATLGYNDKNLAQILRWLDAGHVQTVHLLSSLFFRAHKRGLWLDTVRQFSERKQVCACRHSHAKVITLLMRSGAKYVIERSANLCGNGSGWEQFALIQSNELHDWHSAWIHSAIKDAIATDTAKAALERETREAEQVLYAAAE